MKILEELGYKLTSNDVYFSYVKYDEKITKYIAIDTEDFTVEICYSEYDELIVAFLSNEEMEAILHTIKKLKKRR